MLYPLSYQATWIDGQLWVRHIPDDSDIYEYMKIMCELRMKHEWKLILAVCYQLKQLKKQPEKNSGLNGIRTHGLATLVQCSIHWAA